jgi:hypothetical protein
MLLFNSVIHNPHSDPNQSPVLLQRQTLAAKFTAILGFPALSALLDKNSCDVLSRSDRE